MALPVVVYTHENTMKDFKVGDTVFKYAEDHNRFYCAKVIMVWDWGITAKEVNVPDEKHPLHFMGPHDTFHQYFPDAYEAAVAPIRNKYVKLLDEYRAEINVIGKAEGKYLYGEGWGENDE